MVRPSVHTNQNEFTCSSKYFSEKCLNLDKSSICPAPKRNHFVSRPSLRRMDLAAVVTSTQEGRTLYILE